MPEDRRIEAADAAEAVEALKARKLRLSGSFLRLWLAQVVSSPVFHDVLAVPVFARQPVAAIPIAVFARHVVPIVLPSVPVVLPSRGGFV